VWKFFRSMIVTCAGALANARAAFRPPKPAPTMTTLDLLLMLLLPTYIYKIHAMADGSRTSSVVSPSYRRGWVRWALPSAADLIFIAILAALVFTPLSVKLLNDAGIGWHIRTGQWILSTRTVPHADPFSSTMGGKPWFAWEWLYDIVVGRLDSITGLNGVAWFTALVIAATFAWLFRLLIARGASLPAALVLVLLALAASTIHFLARPHVLSWLFVVAWLWILDSTELTFSSLNRLDQRWLWVLPVLTMVWANVHGGFLLGFVLLACYWFGSLWTWLSTKELRIEESLLKIAAGKRTRMLALAGFASLLVSLLNPYGWNLHGHIFSYLSDRFLMDHIEEFHSPNFHDLAPKCFLVLMVLCVIVVIAHGRKLGVGQLLVFLFAMYAGLYASRNIPIAALMLATITGPLIPRLHVARDFFIRMETVESELRGHVWPILALLLTFGIAMNGGRVGSSQIMDAHFDPARMPVGAVTFLGTREGLSPILSPDYWGGYVIYRLYPNARVVVDDRHDLYGDEILKSYLRTMHLERGWEDFLEQQNPSCMLLPQHSPLATIVGKTPDWRSIYADDVAVVFVRDREHLPAAVRNRR